MATKLLVYKAFDDSVKQWHYVEDAPAGPDTGLATARRSGTVSSYANASAVADQFGWELEFQDGALEQMIDHGVGPS